MVLVLERSLVQQIVPGTRVSVMGIFSINQARSERSETNTRLSCCRRLNPSGQVRALRCPT